jgi:hypothetical protein
VCKDRRLEKEEGCLVGLRLEDSLAGLDDELAQTHLILAQQTANVQLAQTVYTQVRTWGPMCQRSTDTGIPVDRYWAEVSNPAL